jgi:Polysaccharide pyruvyl transferase
VRIAIISKTPRILDAYRHTPEELLVASGGNTGNLAFIHAVDSHIMDDKSYFDWDFDPDHLNDRFDLVFLICANMINPEIDLTELADRFDRLKLPITAASLGVQGETDDSELGVSDSCVRFLHCLSSKSSSFGVRGIRASDCLSRLGIRNFRIIGCPSNFINPDRRLGSRIFSACGDRHLISVAAHIDLLNKRDHQPVCTKLQNLCGGRRARYFVQSPGSYVDIALKSDPQFSERQIAVLTDTFGYRNDVPPLDFIQDNLRCQMSVDHWLLDMRHYDCSIGPRLHGNIVAIQAGVPSLIVCHDARTEELAGTLAIPHVGVPEFLAADSIESIFEARMGLMQKYDARRHVLAVEYLGMLLDHGITVSPALLELTS